MQVHSVEKIKELKRLRKRGYSINEIVARLSIPKTTVWHHIRNVPVLPQYASLLKSKRGGSAARKQKNWRRAKEHAEELLKSPNKNLSIAIAMLYWGEGNKKRCEFINSDGRMIRSYLLILRRVFNIQEKDIMPTLRIFSGMSRTECLNYWSNVTKIPPNRFVIRLNDGCTRSRTKYGMCRIAVKKGGIFLKLIQSLINQFYEEKIIKYELISPCSSMDLEQSRPKGKVGGSSPPEGTF